MFGLVPRAPDPDPAAENGRRRPKPSWASRRFAQLKQRLLGGNLSEEHERAFQVIAVVSDDEDEEDIFRIQAERVRREYAFAGRPDIPLHGSFALPPREEPEEEEASKPVPEGKGSPRKGSIYGGASSSASTKLPRADSWHLGEQHLRNVNRRKFHERFDEISEHLLRVAKHIGLPEAYLSGENDATELDESYMPTELRRICWMRPEGDASEKDLSEDDDFLLAQEMWKCTPPVEEDLLRTTPASSSRPDSCGSAELQLRTPEPSEPTPTAGNPAPTAGNPAPMAGNPARALRRRAAQAEP